ncbi:hypothetical protein [Prochlorococcus sp. MIT 1307]|uniref:hypothetical protein n=1 Tax=Prochlorococcus sp. MIT 1307 TaxID=3096219 RepID=UPI002A75B8F2|nr:hypothetical protein [Prochlorococcus sp. MIT 1307]
MQKSNFYSLYKLKLFNATRYSFISKLISTFILTFTGIQPFTAQAEPYKSNNFNQLKPGRLNISVYVFHDRNRNGSYDLGDLPMAGVVTELTKPNGQIVSANSNKNGYTNYKMALGSTKYQDISQESEVYTFRVLKPPGWQVTAGKSVQKILFLDKVGSPGGLIADKAPNWVGLAPDLSIKGQILGPNKTVIPRDASVTATGPNGKTTSLDLDKDGSFVLPVEPGRWSLVFDSPSLNWQLIRHIKVSTAPVEMIAVIAGQKQLPLQPHPILENFDWLKHSKLEKIPNGHLGLNWDYLLAMNHQNSRGPGYINVLNSGHAVAYNSSGHPVTITAPEGQLFDFVGGFFTVAWSKATGETLELEAFRGNERIAQHEMKLSHLGATWLDADLRSIDKMILSTRHYWQFATEDLQFRLPRKN